MAREINWALFRLVFNIEALEENWPDISKEDFEEFFQFLMDELGEKFPRATFNVIRPERRSGSPPFTVPELLVEMSQEEMFHLTDEEEKQLRDFAQGTVHSIYGRFVKLIRNRWPFEQEADNGDYFSDQAKLMRLVLSLAKLYDHEVAQLVEFYEKFRPFSQQKEKHFWLALAEERPDEIATAVCRAAVRGPSLEDLLKQIERRFELQRLAARLATLRKDHDTFHSMVHTDRAFCREFYEAAIVIEQLFKDLIQNHWQEVAETITGDKYC